MKELAAWLLEQIAEDEREAHADLDLGQPLAEHQPGECSTCDVLRRKVMNELDHAVALDPARVLAECDAKRRIVAECSYQIDNDFGAMATTKLLARFTLKALALPYTDRPGYREEWRP